MEETTPLYTTEEAIKIVTASEQLHKAADLLLMSAETDARGSSESARHLLDAFASKLEEANETMPRMVKADA